MKHNVFLCLIISFFTTSIYAYDPAQSINGYDEINSIDNLNKELVAVGGYSSSEYAGAVYLFENVDGQWNQIAVLSASEGLLANSCWFGYSVAIDGETIIVGAPKSGKVYVYEKPDNGWIDMTETYQLESPFPSGGYYGYSVSLSGDRMAVGSYRSYSYQGRIALYEKSPTEKWSESDKSYETLKSSNPQANEYIGHEIIIKNNTLISGALGNQNWTGAVFVYDLENKKFNLGNVVENAVLTSSSADRQLGVHIAFSEDENLIAATDFGDENKYGTVRIFTKENGTSWTSRNDENFNISLSEKTIGDHFGSQMKIQGDYIAIGAKGFDNNKGVIYEYELSNDRGSVLLLNEYMNDSPQVDEYFGNSFAYLGLEEFVSAIPGSNDEKLYFYPNENSIEINYTKARHVDVDGDYMVLGTYESENNGPGAAFVYHLENEEWVEVAKLLPSDSQDGDQFGFAVAIKGSEIIVGAPNRNKSYVFEMPENGWSNMTETLAIPNPTSNGVFGYSVDINSSAIVVGGYQIDNYSGRGFYITKTANSWSEGHNIQTLISPNPTANEYFAHQIRLSEDAILVGALGKNNWSGTAYVYNIPAEGLIGDTITPDFELEAPGGADHNYGIHLDISDNRIAITDYVRDFHIEGKVHIFEKAENTQWSSDVKHITIHNPEPNSQDGFGTDVHLNGDDLLIGTYYEDIHGVAYLYHVNVQDSIYSAYAKFEPETATEIRFGTGVRFHEEQIIVLAENNPNQFIYTFSKPTFDITSVEKQQLVYGDEVNVSDYSEALIGFINNDFKVIDNKHYVNRVGDFYYTITGYKENVFYDQNFKVTSSPAELEITISVEDANNLNLENYEVVGLKNGDEASDILSGSLAIENTSKENEFIITQGTLEANANYNINFTEVTFSVTLPSLDEYEKVSHIDVDGDNMVLGTYSENGKGAAFVYHFENEQWIEVAKLSPTDGEKSDLFGFAVGIQDDVIVVGAPKADKAYIFEMPEGGWSDMFETKKLTSEVSGYFGYSVDIQDNMVVVGAYQTNAYAGKVYIYQKTEASWLGELNSKQLVSPNPATNEYFGHVIKLHGNTLAVNALGNNNWKGTVYVYNLDENGDLDTTQTPADLSVSNSGEDYQYGIHIDLYKNTILVTDYGRDAIGNVYVYQRDNGQPWTDRTENYVIENPTQELGSGFGSSIHIKGDTVAIGAYRADGIGAAHIFTLNDNEAEWIHTYQLEDGETDELFGHDVKLMEDHIVVVSPNRVGDFYHTFQLPTIGEDNVTSIVGLAKELPKLLNSDPSFRDNARELQFIDLNNIQYAFMILTHEGKVLQKGNLSKEGKIKLNKAVDHVIIQLIDQQTQQKYTFRY